MDGHILVPGGGGFIGQAVIHRLAQLGRLLERMRQGTSMEIRGDGKTVRDYLYDDLVDACLKTLDYPASVTFNVGSGVGHSLNEPSQMAKQATTSGSQLALHYRPARGGDIKAADDVCAVVVAYFPDEGFAERLKIILPQVRALVVVDNTPTESCRQRLLLLEASKERIHFIENRRNAGIAVALNQGLEYALRIGCKWLLTLDQDTRCYPDMVTTLLQAHETCGPKAAVIGGNYFDSQNRRMQANTAEESGCVEQKTVITSGSLIDADVARRLGGFREEYFIDQVDHEFCLRVRAHGYRVMISRKPVMEHSVGGAGGVRLPVLGVLPNHPPLRKYYIARNTVVTVAKYWRREPGWCLRRSVRLLLGLLLMATLEKQRLAKVRAFADGIVDGVRRRMGPCGREWLNRS